MILVRQASDSCSPGPVSVASRALSHYLGLFTRYLYCIQSPRNPPTDDLQSIRKEREGRTGKKLHNVVYLPQHQISLTISSLLLAL